MIHVRRCHLRVAAGGVGHVLTDFEALDAVTQSQYCASPAVADLARGDHLVPDPPTGLAHTRGQHGLLHYVTHPGIGDRLFDQFGRGLRQGSHLRAGADERVLALDQDLLRPHVRNGQSAIMTRPRHRSPCGTPASWAPFTSGQGGLGCARRLPQRILALQGIRAGKRVMPAPLNAIRARGLLTWRGTHPFSGTDSVPSRRILAPGRGMAAGRRRANTGNCRFSVPVTDRLPTAPARLAGWDPAAVLDRVLDTARTVRYEGYSEHDALNSPWLERLAGGSRTRRLAAIRRSCAVPSTCDQRSASRKRGTRRASRCSLAPGWRAIG